MIRHYYQLTKPGIIYGNAMTALAGFFLASKTHINFLLLITMLVGTSLVIASACVFNNYIDQDIDKKMSRTRSRALVEKIISGRNAIVYATVLGLIGFAILTKYTNIVTVIVGLVGFIDYIFLYGIAKRRSTLSTIVGSVSGATPIVAGYTAVTNNFDLEAFLLFLILITWQMPHFYAIAIYRLEDYKNAHLPVLPVKQGVSITKVHILVYIIVFIIAICSLTICTFTGFSYLIVMSLLSLWWLKLSIDGFTTQDTTRWARKLFFFSLVIILSLSAMLSLNTLLP